MTLIQRQEQALAEMKLPRTSEKRAVKHRRAVVRKYRAAAERIGYSSKEIDAQVQDLFDMFRLNAACDAADEDEAE